jgi:endonuclease/exonuclease/phosphatase family metal-dependent hydrolase
LKLKFASYNIHKSIGLDRRRDPDRIISVLREVNADIIALQEVDLRFGQRPSTLPRAMLDDTPWRAAPVARRARSLGWHGNAMLVRRDIDVTHAQPIALPTFEPRGAICVDLQIGDARLRVLGAHLDLSGLRRRDQLRSILAHCGQQNPGVPTVLMGDFNQWSIRRGAMEEFGSGWQVLDTGKSYPSRRPIAPLDRIVASAQWNCVDARVHHSALATRASDHLPVEAVLEVPKN